MPPRDLALEALSAVTECEVKSLAEFQNRNPGKTAPDPLSPQDIVNLFMLGHGKWDNTVPRLMYIPTENDKIRKELFINEEDFFDPRYDFDFTRVNDGAREFRRGNEIYKRPSGWNRFALKVLDKYQDGNGWLGIGADAWPVSYHGTSIDGAKGITQEGYKVGPGNFYGRGIYSTPEVNEALGFSREFTSKSTNKTYRVMLQNRINPQKRKVCDRKNYWLVPVPDGTSADEEKEIVESAIRPYGLLLKEVPPK